MSDNIKGTEDELRAALYALLDPDDIGHAQRAQDTAWRLLHRERDELRAEVVALKKERDDLLDKAWQAAGAGFDELRAEVERLRQELEDILAMTEDDDTARIAREALASHKEC